MMVTEDFKKVAVSFAGGDGGNPNSDVWFCGLEWGIGDESSSDDFYEKFSLSPKLIPHSWVEDDFDGSWTAQYNRKICWFLWYYYNLEWKNGESAEHFVKKYDVLYPQGIGFKLNMLPINFKNRSSIKWNEQFIKLTGFETFDEPILYAKSVENLIYRNNTVIKNKDFKPFHWNKERFKLERTKKVEIIEK